MKPRLGLPAQAERLPIATRRLLSLSGGGFRGLFTARVLERLEAEAGSRLRDRFDLIGGTSIGGLLAIGLAAGIPARRLREAVADYGPQIFRPRLRSLGGFLSAQYAAAPLSAAVDAILGTDAECAFADLPGAVLVIAIDLQAQAPRIFRSAALAGEGADRVSLRDVALATTAAPTYFAPHQIEGRLFVDGALVANAPDLVVMAEAMRRFAAPLEALSVCAVGAASGPAPSRRMHAPGKLGWIGRHDLVSLTIDAQAALAAAQIEALAPGRVLRIDAQPSARLRLDDASVQAAGTLVALADGAIDTLLTERPGQLRAQLAARRDHC